MSTPSGVARGGANDRGKSCVVCGDDVSAKPRTRDKHGRYFCTPCYERALAAKHAKREGMQSPKADGATPADREAMDHLGFKPLADDALSMSDSHGPVHDVRGAQDAAAPPGRAPRPAPRASALESSSHAANASSSRKPQPTAKPKALPKATEPDDSEPNILEGLLDLEAPVAPPPMICPSCRSSIPAGGVVCTMCGYNLQTGDSVKHTRVKMQRQAGGVVWPATVGIISMVLGGGGVVIYGLYLLLAVMGALQAGVLAAALVSVIPVGSLLTSLAAWLFRDGYRILRRNPDGVKWIRFWAMAKLLIYGSCFVILMSAPVRRIDEGLEQLPGLEGQMTGADIKTTILLVMLWFLAWPIFVMVFFFIPRVQDDVEAWD